MKYLSKSEAIACAVISVLLPLTSPAENIITTIAGNGFLEFAGDGGPAAEASLDYPKHVALDSKGDIYIADENHNCIRKIDHTTGIITTIAGNGTSWGYSGDGGPATSSKLESPHSVAIDEQAGVMFIADEGNKCIRMVDTAGIITTPSGLGYIGLYGPRGVAVDSRSNLYFTADNRLRKMDNSGIAETIAGGNNTGFSGDGGPATSAYLNYPFAVATDNTGNIFIADTYNNCIRRIDTAGLITTAAGIGGQSNYGFSGDGGLAIAAQLYRPMGVAVDSQGAVYIADTENHRIRKVDTAGIITTIAGNGIKNFSGDGGSATKASLNRPWGVAIDNQGVIYIADTENHRIRKVSKSSGIDVQLGKGWNLMSLPVKPTDSSIAGVMKALEGKYKSIWTLDESGQWKYYDAGSGKGSLSSLEYGKGYWVEMTEAAVLTVSGTVTGASVTLQPGWNLIGSGSTSKGLSEALSGISGKYNAVWGYTNVEGAEAWAYYDAVSGKGDLSSLDPGRGYWIEATQQCSLTVGN